MSVEHESMLTIGWRIEQGDIPDFDERHDEEWPELEELARRASLLRDSSVWQGELCDEENSWGGDTQIVGVPMLDKELPVSEFMERTEGLAELAKEVYRQVMRREPQDEPCLMSWTKVF